MLALDPIIVARRFATQGDGLRPSGPAVALRGEGPPAGDPEQSKADRPSLSKIKGLSNRKRIAGAAIAFAVNEPARGGAVPRAEERDARRLKPLPRAAAARGKAVASSARSCLRAARGIGGGPPATRHNAKINGERPAPNPQNTWLLVLEVCVRGEP
jgi:hypothetical protein